MALWQLGALVSFGVSLIVFLVHLSGGSRKARLASDAAAIQRYRNDFPASKADAAIRTRSGDAAFLLLSDGSTGLVHAMGDEFLTRRLVAGSLKSVGGTGATLSLKFDDFTFPFASYEFAGPALADLLRQRLST